MRFLRLRKAVLDANPRTADGRRLPVTEGTRKVEAQLAPGPLALVRLDTLTAVLPDRPRPDGRHTSLLHRADGASIQVWESAEEIGAAIEG